MAKESINNFFVTDIFVLSFIRLKEGSYVESLSYIYSLETGKFNARFSGDSILLM